KGAIGSGYVAAARISREKKDVTIAASCENDGIAGEGANRPGTQVTCGNSFGMTVDQHQIEHFGLRKHLDFSSRYLAAESLVGAKQQLLASLPARVKRARDLGAAEGTICQQAAVFAGERHPLFNTLIDDEIADLSKTIDICFARPEIATFNRVIEEPE